MRTLILTAALVLTALPVGAWADGEALSEGQCLEKRRAGDFDRAQFRECKRAAQAQKQAALDETIRGQEAKLAELRAELAVFGIRLDNKNQLIDDGDRVLARIEVIKGELILKEEAEQRSQEAKQRSQEAIESARRFLDEHAN